MDVARRPFGVDHQEMLNLEILGGAVEHVALLEIAVLQDEARGLDAEETVAYR